MNYSDIVAMLDNVDLNDLLERMEFYSKEYRADCSEYNQKMLETYISLAAIKMIVKKGHKSDLLVYDQMKDIIQPLMQNMKGSN